MRKKAGACLSLLLIVGTWTCASGDKEPLLVFAAASLGGPLDSLCAQFMNQTGVPVLLAYGASGSLAQQIRIGADVDMFISADTSWLERLRADKSQPILNWQPFLRNRLVLVTSSKLDVQTRYFGPLDSESIGKIAIADPEAAPAGRYARAYLKHEGLYEKITHKLVILEDVRGVVNAVRLEIADVGFVYASDAAMTPQLRIVSEIPDSLYPPVVYGLAVLRGGRVKDAERLADYLSGPDGDRAFAKAGFLVNPPDLK